MPNLRIVYDNAADRAEITVSSTAGALGADNLLTDVKSEVWRSTGTTETLTLQWDDPEAIGCVALPFCNFTSTATMRVRCYTEPTDVDPVLDTDAQLACAYAPLDLWDWGMLPLGVNAYSYGGGAYGVLWFDPQSVKKVTVDVVDADNDAGYLEAARLVAGAYWSPTYNAEWNPVVTMLDSSQHARSDAGDLRTDVGTRARKVSINLSLMPSADRARMLDIIRGNGMPRPVFFSLFPETPDDPVKEQTYQIYCKLSEINGLTHNYVDAWSSPLELEEI